MKTKLGPKPDAMDIDAYPEDGDYYFDMMCWERRRAELLQARAEKAEALLLDMRQHQGSIQQYIKQIDDHFKEVAP